MTTQQGAPLINLGVDITPEVIEKNKWYAFWDAPFVIPGVRQSSPHVGAARELRARADRGAGSRDRHRKASRRPGEDRCRPDPTDVCTAFRASLKKSGAPTRRSRRRSCSVKTDGARVEVELSRTVDGNLLRQPAVHVLPRLESPSDGSDREDRRAVGRLQI